MADVPVQQSGKPQVPPSWHWRHTAGLIAWSVAVPAAAAAVLGLWMDYRHPAVHSWTLTMLLGGAAAGCVNAWHRVRRERRAMRAARLLADQAERERAEREMLERETAERQAQDRNKPGA